MIAARFASLAKAFVSLALCLGLCAAAEAQKPIRALLIAGGCCHDYSDQHLVLAKGIQARANVQVDVYWTDDGSTNPPLMLFEDENWAAGYDVIIHDECAASNKDVAIVNRILEVHRKIPAVHLHCAMHSFRTGTDLWFKHLGLQSTSHGPQQPIQINRVDKTHPITQPLADWKTGNEELYNNVKVFETAHPLMTGVQQFERNGKTITDKAVVAWTNQVPGFARSFSTTLGHNTETVADARYLDLVTRGLLWSCDQLNEQYLTPFKGVNKVSFISKAEAAIKKRGVMPKGATLVVASATSTQSGNNPENAFDNDLETRWCANGGSYPQSLAWQFEQPRKPETISIDWEFGDRPYRFTVEGSADGKTWKTLLDASKNEKAGNQPRALTLTEPVKFMRINGLGGSPGSWCSIRQVALGGDKFSVLWPSVAKGVGKTFAPKLADPYKTSGNMPPTMEKMTAQREADILKDVRVPDGFKATLFAAPPAVNYPVFVASAPDGTVYVSSDGNGSLGRDPGRGRVIRLRDLDGDGRADETKVFCEVDAPRGLVWDHDRLYLMHPPHLSVFIDHDKDGVSDEQRILVRDLAFGYDKRPADHTTNGLSMGPDGWLYVAGGDFGFIDATGTDGRKLTHRGGGVIRVRPDGTGLELYSNGTRNILEVAISPRLDMFARDNTNDGGGWDVRFHHFTGSDDHGYPRLYKNFADECIVPLADYGGGSGCGAVYVDEPGFGSYNDAPLTADWGTGALWHHSVRPKGATFEETQTPQPLVRMTRPTDADVDGHSRLYCASWKGATFKWQGPDVGYIVCVQPIDAPQRAMPDFASLSSDQLAALFDDPSYRRRLAAQRELSRRQDPRAAELLNRVKSQRTAERNLVEDLQTTEDAALCAKALSHADSVVVHVAIQQLGKRGAAEEAFAVFGNASSDTVKQAALRALAMIHREDVVSGLMERYESATAKSDRAILFAAICRLNFREAKWNGDSWGTRPDTRGPYYQPIAWEQTDRIQAFLQRQLGAAPAEDAAAMVATMNRNRMESSQGLQRLLQLALVDGRLMPQAVKQIAAAKELPAQSMAVLAQAIKQPKLDGQSLLHCVEALSRMNEPAAIETLVKTLVRMQADRSMRGQYGRAQKVALESALVQNQVGVLIQMLGVDQPALGATESDCCWAMLLQVASTSNASPEALELAEAAIESAWQDASSQAQLIKVAGEWRNHLLDGKIWSLYQSTENADLKRVAIQAVKQLDLVKRMQDDSPKLGTLSAADALAMVASMPGDVQLGKELFKQASCVNCHTVTKAGPQQGPYLGNIAKTYKRDQLAEAILIPSKTIAQGFATTQVLTIDGEVITGFVTDEQAEQVTIRDAQAKDHVISKDDIEVRKQLKTSVMPEGLLKTYSVKDLASLLDYLVQLSK